MAIVDTHEVVDTYDLNGTEIVVVGFNWNTESERWEYHDLFHAGECLNLGEPWGEKTPTYREVQEFVEHNHPDLLVE